MLDATTSLTVQARVPNPYVHVDNRGLILCNGPRCVCVPGAQLRTVAETFEIIADEKREIGRASCRERVSCCV